MKSFWLSMIGILSFFAVEANEQIIETQWGKVAIWDSRGEGPVALLLHGNSACKEVFQKQFESLGDRFRLIAMDLPGHGQSEYARDPERVYSIVGFADVAIEVLEKMGIEKASIVGWSLGGHVAIQMLKTWPGTEGILITGTPPIPITAEGFSKGFLPFPCLHLMGQEELTEEEARIFVTQGGVPPEEAPFLLDATMRADGKARKHLISSMFQGIGDDQKAIVETTNKPVAVVCGLYDTGVNNDYIQNEIAFHSLFKSKIFILEGGHGVFWSAPNEFNAIITTFLEEMNCEKKETFFLPLPEGEEVEIYLQSPQTPSSKLVISLCRGSMESGIQVKRNSEWFQHWVNKGYHVAEIALPGYDYTPASKADFCGPFTRHVLNFAVDNLVQKLNAKQIGVIGRGHAGLAALFLAIDRNDLNCVICANGLCNLEKQVNKETEFLSVLRKKGYRVDLNDAKAVSSRVPLNYVDAIETPVFILHRSPHPLVELCEIEEFAEAMKARGKECEVAIREKTPENHRQRISYQEVLQVAEKWFDAHME